MVIRFNAKLAKSTKVIGENEAGAAIWFHRNFVSSVPDSDKNNLAA